jgi:hypothetical protein
MHILFYKKVRENFINMKCFVKSSLSIYANNNTLQLSGHHITIQALRAAPHLHFEISKGKNYPTKIQPLRRITSTHNCIACERPK